MKKYLLPVIAAAEVVVIILLAVLLLNSADRKDLSHLSEEKQISYLHSEGVEFDEKYNAYALLMIKKCESNPDFEEDIAILYGEDKPELSAIRNAVNKFYGRNTEG